MRPFTFPTLLALIGLGLCGCAETPSARYQEGANAKFAEIDARARIWDSARLKYPATFLAMREVVLRKEKTTPPKFLGTAQYGRPGPPYEKIWVTLVIDHSGQVTAVECAPDGEQPVKPIREALIKATTLQWKFSPATVEGRPVPAINIFPSFATDRTFYVAEARELQY